MVNQAIASRCRQGRPKDLQEVFGFTLIELLVVISVIALLLAILLPTLIQARQSSRSLQCLSNQSQMMTGWSAAMADNGHTIPYILPIGMPEKSSDRDLWWGLLAEQYDELRQPVYGQGADPENAAVCPALDTLFDRPIYSSVMFGYSVNGRWSASGPIAEHSLQSWDNVRNPSLYPWFSDPVAVMKGLYHTDSVFGKSTAPDWGLGFYHPDQAGNTAFADGHATSYQSSVLESAPVSGIPQWLLTIRSP